VVGVHFTTIYRIQKAEDPKLLPIVEARLTTVVEAMEELVEAGKLPFGKHQGLTQPEEPAALRALIEEIK